MKYNEPIFKDYLYRINEKLEKKKCIEIFYQIIDIDHQYFFAQEISTGCIFPVFYTNNINGSVSFATQSYLRYGNYFIFAYIIGNHYKLGKYYFNSDMQRKITYVPLDSEIEEYLKEMKKDHVWTELIEELEKRNVYWCDVEDIKRKFMISGKGIGYSLSKRKK